MEKKEKVIKIFDESYHYYGCCFGQPDGTDDYYKECDCGMTEIMNQMYLIRESIDPNDVLLNNLCDEITKLDDIYAKLDLLQRDVCAVKCRLFTILEDRKKYGSIK